MRCQTSERKVSMTQGVLSTGYRSARTATVMTSIVTGNRRIKMGWLYSVSRSPKNLGEIIKEKGEIRMKSGKRWGEQDRYYFSPGGTDNSIKWVPLTYGFKPTDGLMVRRRVFLEVENDEKALRMISNDYEKATIYNDLVHGRGLRQRPS